MVRRRVAFPTFRLELPRNGQGMGAISRYREAVSEMGAHVGARARELHRAAQFVELQRGIAPLPEALREPPVGDSEFGIAVERPHELCRGFPVPSRVQQS